ncbi:unnamed protein product, partial [Brugia timori]|uniref:C2H2-type domain-containing protein n=1 Tax=Brugia timori TaxID=42155 RepID=A0A0R3QWK3_9BILA
MIGRMLEQGVTVCSSGNKPIGMESANMYSKIAEVVTTDAVRQEVDWKYLAVLISLKFLSYPSLISYLQTSLNGASKNILNIERMSPASVDSGFDSSFPSSPDCSLDSSVVGAEMTKCCKDTNFKRRHQTAIALAVTSQCPLSVCQPSCSSFSSPISRTSSGISTLSTSSLISTDTKTDENFCLDECLLEKTASLTSLSSSTQLVTDVSVNQDLGVPSTDRLGNSAESGCSTVPSFSGSSSSEVTEFNLRLRCHWKGCTERFASDNDLYDHVVK